MPDFTKTDAELSAEFAKLMQQDAGKGLSDDPNDLLRPFLTVLQNNSPEVSKRDPAYIENAQPGDFYAKATGLLRSGVDGIEVTVIAITHGFVEWAADRQGFIARYDQCPDDVVLQQQEGSRRRQLVRSSTHSVIEETKDIWLLHERQLYIFACTSTKLQFARQLQTYFRALRLPGTDITPPIFARRYLFTTTPKANAQGTWLAPKFADLGWVKTVADYKEAAALADLAERKPEPIGAAAPAKLVSVT